MMIATPSIVAGPSQAKLEKRETFSARIFNSIGRGLERFRRPEPIDHHRNAPSLSSDLVYDLQAAELHQRLDDTREHRIEMHRSTNNEAKANVTLQTSASLSEW